MLIAPDAKPVQPMRNSLLVLPGVTAATNNWPGALGCDGYHSAGSPLAGVALPPLNDATPLAILSFDSVSTTVRNPVAGPSLVPLMDPVASAFRNSSLMK